MQQMNQPGNQKQPENMPQQQGIPHLGGHEVFDTHEVISGVISMLDHYKLYEQHIQDPELMDILKRQTAFVTQTYNTIVETFKTGKDPSVPTQNYEMQQDNDAILGMKPGQPKKPKTSVNEISDQGISAYMLGHTKSLSPLMATAATEMTNPVLRRVIADSVPNFIEMGYEIFLYQNKHGYYQVAQLNQQDMQQMLNSYTTVQQGNQLH
jgi:spore coat protein CotF